MKTTTKNSHRFIDTVTRRRSGIACRLLETSKGFVVVSIIGSVRRETEPMTREKADDLWRRLQTVGTPSWKG